MERTNSNSYTMEIGWKDIGSWNQLWDYSSKDKSGNVVKGMYSLKIVKLF